MKFPLFLSPYFILCWITIDWFDSTRQTIYIDWCESARYEQTTNTIENHAGGRARVPSSGLIIDRQNAWRSFRPHTAVVVFSSFSSCCFCSLRRTSTTLLVCVTGSSWLSSQDGRPFPYFFFLFSSLCEAMRRWLLSSWAKNLLHV